MYIVLCLFRRLMAMLFSSWRVTWSWSTWDSNWALLSSSATTSTSSNKTSSDRPWPYRWTDSQYLLSLAFVVVQDVFISHSLVSRGQAPDFFCQYIGTFHRPEHFLFLIFNCTNIWSIACFLNIYSSHLCCFLGFLESSSEMNV